MSRTVRSRSSRCRSNRFAPALLASALIAVIATIVLAPALHAERTLDLAAQRTPPAQKSDEKPEKEAEVAEVPPLEDEEVVDALLVDNLADVRKAVVQIEAVGTFVDPEEGLRANTAGRGSGFIIDEAGIAVTNNHVVTGGALFRVYVDGQEEPLNARVLGVSECADLAVIDIQGDGYHFLDWYPDRIRVGLDVYAVGFPLGDPEFTMTRGIVAKERADGDTSWASVAHVLQHDADINPGNSGGPLVDRDGRVVGINYRLNEAGQYFAISRDEALGIIDQLRRGEDVDSLGINSEAVSDGENLFGIWAASIKSGSPADKVGLLPGDIILSIEGLDLATDGTMATYCEILRSHAVTDVLAMEVLRLDTGEVLEGQINGRPLELSFSLASSLEGDDADQAESTLEPAPAYETYMTITDEQGIIAVEVPESWSEVSEETWNNTDEEAIGVQLWAAPDLDAFANGWATPGLIFSYSDQLNADFSTDDLLDAVDYGNTCTYAGRSALPDGFYSGSYDLWEACGEEGTTGLVLALRPESDDYLVRLEIYSVTEADLEALDRILDTFQIRPAGEPDARVAENVVQTIDDIDTSGLINEYALLDDPAFSALIPADWAEIEGGDWLIDDEPYGLNVNAAPDLAAYREFWSAPGLEVYMGPVDDDMDPYALLDELDYSDDCTYEDRIEHRHAIYGIAYAGAVDIWRDCGSEGNTLLVLSAISDPADHFLIINVQAVNDADFEAFDLLQRSFYVNTGATAPLIDDPEGASRRVDPQDYVSLVDAENAFSLSVPANWDDVINDDWLIDGDYMGRSLSAAPNLDDFEAKWDTPGVFFGLSQVIAEAFTPDELLDVLDFSDECDYDDRYAYDDGTLLGTYDIWNGCGGMEEQAFVVLAVNPIDDDSQIGLFYVNIVSDADLDAFEQMLATLALDDGATILAARAVETAPTATIVTNALNVRSGPGTNYARVDALYRDDEVTVAGQSDDCAWLQIITPAGQPGWISGSARYVTLNGDCAVVPAAAPAASGSASGSGRAAPSGQGCYIFQNQLGAELNLTFTHAETGWNSNFKVPPKGESRQCFDPGPYTYTLDAPPPWGSSNGELNVSAGDNYAFPIYGQ